MTATSHAIVGASIGVAISNPVLAVAVALSSHFLLDIVPHFGIDTHIEQKRRPNLLKYSIISDMTLLSIVFGLLVVLNAPLLALACAFIAISPDFAWGYRFVFLEKFGKKPQSPRNWFNEFHARIQRFESVKGIFIEIPLVIAVASYILTR